MPIAHPRVTVIGGGIVGAFAAYFLAQLGAEPTVVERGEVAGEASGRNHGALNSLHSPGIPSALHDLALVSLRLHMKHWETVGRLSGTRFGARFVSRLQLAMDENEASALISLVERREASDGCSGRWLSASELRRIEPRLCWEAVGGLWTTGNTIVDPGRYTRSVATAATALGSKIVRAEARSLQHRGGRVTSVALDSGSIDCDAVVLACGAWCEEPARWLGVSLPVKPVKGEMLLVQPAGAMPVAEVMWRRVGVYGASAGRVWLGETEDYDGLDSTPTASARVRILEGAASVLPGFAPVQVVQQIAGLRPVTPDGCPIVGIPGGWENVCLAVGVGSEGMLLSAGIALASAELVTGGSTHLPIRACAPGRWPEGTGESLPRMDLATHPCRPA